MKLLVSVLVALAGIGAPAAWAQSLFNEAVVQAPFKGQVTDATYAFDANAGEHYRGSAAASALAAFGVLKVGGTAKADFYLEDAVNPTDGFKFTVVDSGGAFSLHHYDGAATIPSLCK